jgi:hypothetical protein
MTPDVFGFDQTISSTPKYTETAIPVEKSQNSSEEVVSASNSDDDDDGYMSEVWIDFSNLDEESEVDNESDEEYVPHKRRKKGKTCEVSSGSSSQDDTDSAEENVPKKEEKKGRLM